MSNVRRFAVVAHRVMGITLGVWLTIEGLTGSILVWRGNTDHSQFRASQEHVVREDVDHLMRIVWTKHPGAVPSFMILPQGPRDPLQVVARENGRRISLYIDPYSGSLLGEKQPSPAWLDSVANLHNNFLDKRTGREIVGLLGASTMVLLASGLWLFFSPSRALCRKLRLHARTKIKVLAWQTHQIVGVMVTIPLLGFAITGFHFAWSGPLTCILAWHSSSARSRTTATASIRDGAIEPYERFLLVAQRALPDADPRELVLPSRPLDAVEVRMHREGDLAATGNVVYLDPADASVLRITRWSELSPGVRLLNLLEPFHTGELFGVPGKVLWSVIGLAPLLLVTSGGIWWLSRP